MLFGLDFKVWISLLIVFLLVVGFVYLHVTGKLKHTYLWYRDRNYYKKIHRKYQNKA